MRRILDPGQIEPFAQRTILRIRLPDRRSLFITRAQRLRQLGQSGAAGQAIGEYLRLMTSLAEAQHAAQSVFEPVLPGPAQLALSHTHKMPVVEAADWLTEQSWHGVVQYLCDAVARDGSIPERPRETCRRLSAESCREIDARANAVLAAQANTSLALPGEDVAAAPFLMAALQVCFAACASRLAEDDIGELEVPGLCPTCGSLPVASIVRADQGYRYLHCALCATEWHLVRVTCSHCQNTRSIAYHAIEDTCAAVRAETCDECHGYRKILYQEKDAGVEPVADDLASLALDVLMAEAGYHRMSGNPLLWQG
jgi:FdhE protein